MTAPNNIQTAFIQRAAYGDTDAQAWLYNRYSKAMFNICTRMTGNTAYAEDVLHDAFILAFKNIQQLKQPEAFAGWLKQIVVNACINHSKKTFRWQNWDEIQYEAADEPALWWTNISLEMVHREIKKLPDGCREIFVLYAMEEYTHRAISAELGITEGTSKSQYHRARKLLRQKLNMEIITNG